MNGPEKSRRLSSIVALLLAATVSCSGAGTANPAAPALETPVPAVVQSGTTYTGRNGYIEYTAGDLPIIITVPHGGTLTPTELPNRTNGLTVRDTNTDDLAMLIVDAFIEETGRRPHLIVNRLHRRKLDPNRDVAEAANGNVLSERAWREFHTFVDAARKAIGRNYKRGLLIDIHGHGHAIPRLELGYLLQPEDLARPDSALNRDVFADRSSIRALADQTDLSFAALLRGGTSLGAFFMMQGYDAVPSPKYPHPAKAPYFAGGYITEHHGSRNNGRIDAIQIESHFVGVRDTPANRRKFARAVATAITQFMNAHYPE